MRSEAHRGRTIGAAIALVVALAAAAQAQQPAGLVPYVAPSGTAISLYLIKECAVGSAPRTRCVTDADCPGSATVGRCQEVGAQGMVPIPFEGVHGTAQIACGGLSTPVTLGPGWAPAQWLRISSAPGNRRAFVGYTGVSASTGQFIDGGTLSFGMWTVGLDGDSIVFLCELGDLITVAVP